MKVDASIWQHVQSLEDTITLNVLAPILDQIIHDVNNVELLQDFHAHLARVLADEEERCRVFWQVWKTKRWREKQHRRNLAFVKMTTIAYISGYYRGKKDTAAKMLHIFEAYEVVPESAASQNDRRLNLRAFLEGEDRVRDLLGDLADSPYHLTTN